MRKFVNVDIVAVLGAVTETNTEHYKSDFQYDIEMFHLGATHPDGINNHLIWFSRPSGTECFLERNTYIKETSAYNTCQYHADTKDSIIAYAVEITGMENGRPVGNLFEMDIRKLMGQLEKHAMLPEDVTLYMADGTERRLPYDEYQSNWAALKDRYGEISRVRFEVSDESSLRQRLEQLQRERQKYTSAVFKPSNSNRKQSVRARLADAQVSCQSSPPKEPVAKTGPEL